MILGGTFSASCTACGFSLSLYGIVEQAFSFFIGQSGFLIITLAGLAFYLNYTIYTLLMKNNQTY